MPPEALETLAAAATGQTGRWIGLLALLAGGALLLIGEKGRPRLAGALLLCLAAAIAATIFAGWLGPAP